MKLRKLAVLSLLLPLLSLTRNAVAEEADRTKPAVKTAPSKPSLKKTKNVTMTRDVLVGFRPRHDNVRTVTNLLGAYGKLIVREPQTHSYRIRLRDGITMQDALRKIRAHKGVAFAETNPEIVRRGHYDINSVRELTRLIDLLESQARTRRLAEGGKESREEREREERERERERAHRKGTAGKQVTMKIVPRKPEIEAEDESAGTDALRAHLYWLQRRAYPNDRVDVEAYKDAVSQRESMIPFQTPGTRAPGSKRVQNLPAPGSTNKWQFVGPTNLDVPYRIYWGLRPVNGRVNAMAFDPKNPNIYYVGTPGGGLWKTIDAGSTWTALGDAWPFMQCSSVAVDPSNSNIIYAGTGDYDAGLVLSGGLMKSSDGGATWISVGGSTFADVSISSILIDPTNPQKLTVTTGRGASSQGRVYQSLNGGNSWTAVIGTIANWNNLTLGKADSNGKRQMYATAETGNGGLGYRSDDGGSTWTKLTLPTSNNYQINLRVAASVVDSNTVYLISATDGKAWKSTDSGGSWTDISSGLNDFGQGFYDIHITTSSAPASGGGLQDVVYVGLVDIFQSPAPGQAFRSVGGPTPSNNAITHNDQHGMAINPSNPNQALIGNDGGIYRFTYNPSAGTWQYNHLSKNIGITQFYHADWHPTNPNIMLGGTQDNASPFAAGDLANWRNVAGGDGGGSVINQVNPNIQFATSYFLQVYRTGNSWASSSYITPNTGSDNAPFVSVIALDPNDPSILYGGTNYLWKWNDKTSTWTGRVGGQALSTNGTIDAIAVAPGDSKRIYTGSDDAQLWMTANSGTSWTQINSGSPSLPNRVITSISVNPTTPTDILVGLSGTGASHLWRCRNTAAGTRIWENVGAGLPNVPLNSITRDFYDTQKIWYVGTDIGVFATTNAGASWTNATQPLGLPNVQVNEIRAVPGTGYLNVATYGRGMWRIKLNPPFNTLVSMNIDPKIVLGGQPSTGSVVLDGPSISPGAVVTLTSSDPTVATVPAQITVPTNATVGSFPITTKSVTSAKTVTITASTGGTTLQADLTVVASETITNVTFNPNPACGGMTSVGTVKINVPARNGGLTVNLTSSNTGLATVPTSVVIPAGQTSAPFNVTVGNVSAATSVNVTATAGASTMVGTLNLLPIIASATANPQTIAVGSQSTILVTLNCPAPANGVTISIVTDNPVVTFSTPLTIAAGQTQGTFKVTGQTVSSLQTANLTVSAFGSSKVAVVNVSPLKVASVTFNPAAVTGGNSSTGTVTLTAAAPAGGVPVTLTSGSANVKVPSSVTVAAGSMSVNFTATTTTIQNTTAVPVTANLFGQSASGPLTVNSASLFSISVTPSTINGGSFGTGRVNLDSLAGPAGTAVQLSSSDTSVATVMSTVVVQSGTTSNTFTVNAMPIATQKTAVITATLNGVSKTFTVTVQPTSGVNFTANPTTLRGGTRTLLTVNLGSPAPPGGITIQVSSNNPQAVPSTTVFVPASSSSASVNAQTFAVTSVKTVVLTAVISGQTKTVTLTITP